SGKNPKPFVCPRIPLDSLISGKRLSLIPKIFRSSLSHEPLLIFISCVLEALLTSVTCEIPFVSFQIKKLSIVPAANSLFLILGFSELLLSIIHLILEAEKYGSMTRPVLDLIFALNRVSFLQKSVVRRHCQTMALYTGRDVLLSHMTTVSL